MWSIILLFSLSVPTPCPKGSGRGGPHTRLEKVVLPFWAKRGSCSPMLVPFVSGYQFVGIFKKKRKKKKSLPTFGVERNHATTWFLFGIKNRFWSSHLKSLLKYLNEIPFFFRFCLWWKLVAEKAKKQSCCQWQQSQPRRLRCNNKWTELAAYKAQQAPKFLVKSWQHPSPFGKKKKKNCLFFYIQSKVSLERQLLIRLSDYKWESWLGVET